MASQEKGLNMKTTKEQLKKLIRESVKEVVAEQYPPMQDLKSIGRDRREAIEKALELGLHARAAFSPENYGDAFEVGKIYPPHIVPDKSDKRSVNLWSDFFSEADKWLKKNFMDADSREGVAKLYLKKNPNDKALLNNVVKDLVNSGKMVKVRDKFYTVLEIGSTQF
jgi:hypothetical protein